MIDEETTVEIARPVEEVFAFVADQTHAPQWQVGLHAAWRTGRVHMAWRGAGRSVVVL